MMECDFCKKEVSSDDRDDFTICRWDKAQNQWNETDNDYEVWCCPECAKKSMEIRIKEGE